jgi:hypothetical protein
MNSSELSEDKEHLKK